MKNRGITLVSLVITIIILIILTGISLNLTLGENGLFQMALKAKENMELAQTQEEEQLNVLYTQLESEVSGDGSEGTSYDIIGKLVEFKKAIADYIGEAGGEKPEYTAEKEEYGEAIKGIVANVTKDTTATKEQILLGQTAWIKGQLVTGTMPNNGAVNKTLKAGENYTIAKGYHDGNGSITVSGLTEQTTGNAKAAEILAGKIAWVNGAKVTGSMKNNGPLNPAALKASGSYTIPAGYTSGGKVTAQDLASQTQGDATEEDIAEGKIAWVNGKRITGNSSFSPENLTWDYKEVKVTAVANEHVLSWSLKEEIPNYQLLVLNETLNPVMVSTFAINSGRPNAGEQWILKWSYEPSTGLLTAQTEGNAVIIHYGTGPLEMTIGVHYLKF